VHGDVHDKPEILLAAELLWVTCAAALVSVWFRPVLSCGAATPPIARTAHLGAPTNSSRESFWYFLYYHQALGAT
jgi:hypothetical protein